MSAKFEKHPLKTVRAVVYTNPIPYRKKSCQKRLSLKAVIQSKLILAPSKSHINSPNMSIIHPLKTVGGADYTNSILNSAKSCQKWLNLKGSNSVIINCSSIKNPHSNMSTICLQCLRNVH